VGTQKNKCVLCCMLHVSLCINKVVTFCPSVSSSLFWALHLQHVSEFGLEKVNGYAQRSAHTHTLLRSRLLSNCACCKVVVLAPSVSLVRQHAASFVATGAFRPAVGGMRRMSGKTLS